jgi:hypothetical protein
MSSQARGSAPQDRYGAPSRARDVALRVLVVAVAAAFLGWLTWAALHQASQSVTGRVSGFTVISQHAVRVTLLVDGSGGDSVVCTVEARAADHGLVGSQDVTVPAGESGSVPFEATIRTDREATTADVTGCRR